MDLSPTVRVYHGTLYVFVTIICTSGDTPLVAVEDIPMISHTVSISRIFLRGVFLSKCDIYHRADWEMAWAPDWKSWHSCPRRVCREHRGCELRYLWGALRTITGWWFQPLWTIFVSWVYYSQYMEKNKSVPNHQPVMKKWSNHIRDYHPNAPWRSKIFTNIYIPSKSPKCSYIHHAWSIWVMALLLIKCIPTTSPNWESRNSVSVLVCVAWTTGLGCIGSGSKIGQPMADGQIKTTGSRHAHTHTSKGSRHSSRTIRERPSLKANQTWQETYPFDPFAIGKASIQFKK